MSTLAAVRLWGTRIGAVSMPDDGRVAAFQYDRDFLASGIEVSPLVMPMRSEPYTFPTLNPESFHGLPGLLSDSLPDRYGRALIDAWLAGQGRTPESFDAVERLCYIGRRGMGALEFAPSLGPAPSRSHNLQVSELVELASEVLSRREELVASLAQGHQRQAMLDILSVGASAGGARAKAVIAWNPTTDVVRSGQLDDLSPGFEHWLLKFDGVANNRDRDALADPQRYGAIEYAYSLMARDAGIAMSECRLLEENGRRHFMTRRFDRGADGAKRHVQSLGALAHFDFNQPGAHSYEQAFLTMRRLGLAEHGGRADVPPDGVQHHGAQPGRPRQEHRVPDGPRRTMGARARIRPHLRLPALQRVDRPAPDEHERQARALHAGRLPGLRPHGLASARACDSDSGGDS